MMRGWERWDLPKVGFQTRPGSGLGLLLQGVPVPCKRKMTGADLHRFREAVDPFLDSGAVGTHFLDVKVAIGYRGDLGFIGYS